jgi:hypothetical protein
MVALNASAKQSNKPAATPAQASKAQSRRDYRVPLLTEGLRLSDFAGMKPRPELKGKLLHIAGFIQNTPRDGQPKKPRSGWGIQRAPCISYSSATITIRT